MAGKKASKKVVVVKRRRFRRRNKGNKKVVYPVCPPPNQRLCLKYSDCINYQLSSLQPTKIFIYRPNCLYDPDYTGVGHQSLFRDQMFGLYQFARTVGFKITVKLVSDSLTPCEVVLYRMPDVGSTLHDTAREIKGARKGLLTSQKALYLNTFWLVDKFLENKKYTCLTDELYKQTPTAALPGDQSCWMGLSMKYLATSGTVNIYYEINIKQYSKFEEPIMPTQS